MAIVARTFRSKTLRTHDLPQRARQIGLHEKPILLLDAGGYWHPLVALLDHVVAQGFAQPSLRDFVTVVPDVPALEHALRAALPQAAASSSATMRSI